MKRPYITTICTDEHRVNVRPATIVGNKAIYGSAADFCDKTTGRGRTKTTCEKRVVRVINHPIGGKR